MENFLTKQNIILENLEHEFLKLYMPNLLTYLN